MSLSSLRPPLLQSVDVADFDTVLEHLSQQLGATAHIYDESGEFPLENFKLLHEHGQIGRAHV